jgi:hypothetical protein
MYRSCLLNLTCSTSLHTNALRTLSLRCFNVNEHQGEAVIYASLELYESNGSVEDLLDTFVVSSSILCLYFQSIVT